jgi:CRP/FNR family cyclic AMP-dependent transcriptional regulator
MQVPYGLNLVENCETCATRGASYFCQLPVGATQSLQAIKHTSSYPSGALLFVEGQVPRGVYLLCRGRVKLTMASPEGKTLIMRIAEPGEVLGIHATVTGKPYELTAETLEPCQVNFIKSDEFTKFVRQNSDVYGRTVQQLSDYYRAACHRVRCMGLSRSAPEKMARFLLEWAEKGTDTRQGTRVNLNLTHEEIAQIVSVSRETVTRTLSSFKAQQIISISGPSVLIRDKARLESMLEN